MRCKQVLQIKDECRANFNPYLMAVFSDIPRPFKGVLDIGCGSGVSSSELARNYHSSVTAMDIDEAALDFFRKKVAGTALEQRIDIACGTFETAIERRMKFDVVLAEGLFNIIGVDVGLRHTCAVLNPRGFLVLHDGQDELQRSRAAFDATGFALRKTLKIDESTWGELYCTCLDRRIADIDRCGLAVDELEELEKIEAELAFYRNSPQSFRSVYCLLEKRLEP